MLSQGLHMQTHEFLKRSRHPLAHVLVVVHNLDLPQSPEDEASLAKLEEGQAQRSDADSSGYSENAVAKEHQNGFFGSLCVH